MSGLNRGPGGGPKRRIRTQLRAMGNLIVVSLNRSVKRLPGNWRELLGEMLINVCASPPSHFYLGQAHALRRAIPRPSVIIPVGSLPTSQVSFVLDLDPEVARLQRRAIDWSLALCDVKDWPVPTTTVRRGAGGECFIATNLPQRDTLTGDARHSFRPELLRGIPGINWLHVRQYTVLHGKGHYLGIRTSCGKPCSCRQTLPSAWHLGWEMHY